MSELTLLAEIILAGTASSWAKRVAGRRHDHDARARSGACFEYGNRMERTDPISAERDDYNKGYELADAAGLQRSDSEPAAMLRGRGAARGDGRADAAGPAQADLGGVRQRVPDELQGPTLGRPLLSAGILGPADAV